MRGTCRRRGRAGIVGARCNGRPPGDGVGAISRRSSSRDGRPATATTTMRRAGDVKLQRDRPSRRPHAHCVRSRTAP
jgi:hypothetical protein